MGKARDVGESTCLHLGGLNPPFLRYRRRDINLFFYRQKSRIEPTWVKGWRFRGYFLDCGLDARVNVWIARFSKKRSSRPKMNLYNVYRGGLIPTYKVGISPPPYA